MSFGTVWRRINPSKRSHFVGGPPEPDSQRPLVSRHGEVCCYCQRAWLSSFSMFVKQSRVLLEGIGGDHIIITSKQSIVQEGNQPNSEEPLDTDDLSASVMPPLSGHLPVQLLLRQEGKPLSTSTLPGQGLLQTLHSFLQDFRRSLRIQRSSEGQLSDYQAQVPIILQPFPAPLLRHCESRYQLRHLEIVFNLCPKAVPAPESMTETLEASMISRSALCHRALLKMFSILKHRYPLVFDADWVETLHEYVVPLHHISRSATRLIRRSERSSAALSSCFARLLSSSCPSAAAPTPLINTRRQMVLTSSLVSTLLRNFKSVSNSQDLRNFTLENQGKPHAALGESIVPIPTNKLLSTTSHHADTDEELDESLAMLWEQDIGLTHLFRLPYCGSPPALLSRSSSSIPPSSPSSQDFVDISDLPDDAVFDAFEIYYNQPSGIKASPEAQDNMLEDSTLVSSGDDILNDAPTASIRRQWRPRSAYCTPSTNTLPSRQPSNAHFTHADYGLEDALHTSWPTRDVSQDVTSRMQSKTSLSRPVMGTMTCSRALAAELDDLDVAMAQFWQDDLCDDLEDRMHIILDCDNDCVQTS